MRILGARIFSKFFGGKIEKILKRFCQDKILAKKYFKSTNAEAPPKMKTQTWQKSNTFNRYSSLKIPKQNI